MSPESPKRGRPSLFTPERVAAILAIVAGGGNLVDAAATVGVHKKTVERWLRHGRRTGTANAAYQEFCARYMEHEARSIIDSEKLVTIASKKDVDTAKWLLERRRPHLWGPRSNEFRRLQKQVAELEKIVFAREGATHANHGD